MTTITITYMKKTWSNTLKQFVGFYRRIVCMCLTILWRRSGIFIVNFEHVNANWGFYKNS